VVRVSANDLSCVKQGIVEVLCSFAGADTEARYNPTTNTIDCLTPAGLAGSTGVFTLKDKVTGGAIWPAADVDQPAIRSGATTVTFPSSKLFFSFLPDSDFDALPNPLSDTTLCADCANVNTEYCVPDCSGQFRGAATLDGCGECAGGTSGKVPEADRNCDGICFGLAQQAGDQCSCGGLDACFAVQDGEPELAQQYVEVVEVGALAEVALVLSDAVVSVNLERGFTALDLPWTFWYYGLPFRSLFISPQGALFFGPPPATCTAFPTAAAKLDGWSTVTGDAMSGVCATQNLN
jgi:hypothetical protein